MIPLSGKEREAFPVRAIPLVTCWDISPHQIAMVLVGEDCSFQHGLAAYILEDGKPTAIPQADWRLIFDQLEALSANIPEGVAGKYEWRSRSIAELPATAFLWADEFSDAYRKSFNNTEHLEHFAGEILHATGEVNIPIVVPDQLRQIALEGFCTEDTKPASIDPETSYGPKRDSEISERCKELKASGVRAWQAQVAAEFGVSKSAIKEALKRHDRKRLLPPPTHVDTGISAQLNALSAANKRQKK